MCQGIAASYLWPLCLSEIKPQSTPLQQPKFSLKGSSGIQDFADECPVKKRCLAYYLGKEEAEALLQEVASIREDLEKFAAEVGELLDDIQGKLEMFTN